MRALAVGLVAVLLTGCAATTASTAGDRVVTNSEVGFVAGDGSITFIEASKRVAAPDVVGTMLDGGELSLDSLKGHVVVLNVWASWCAPCRAEAPTLERTYQDLKGQGVQFIGLDTRDSAAAAKAFIEAFSITYPNVIDTDGKLQLLFRDSLPPQAIPSTIVIDQSGRVAGRIIGKASESSLKGIIEPLLRETQRPTPGQQQ